MKAVSSVTRSVSSKLFSKEVVPSPVHPQQQEQKEEERCGETCVLTILFLAIAGLVLVCVGGVLYSGHNTNERDVRIGEVNAAIRAWKKGAHGAELAGGNFSIILTTSGCAAEPSSSCPCYNGTYPMKATASPPDVFIDGSDKLTPYTQLRLVFNGTSQQGWQYPVSASEDCVLKARVMAGQQEVAALEQPFVSQLSTKIAGKSCPSSLSSDLAANSVEIANCRSACSKVGGIFTVLGLTYTCTTPYYITRECVRVVTQAASGTFQEAVEEGRGCYAPNQLVRQSLTTRQVLLSSTQLLQAAGAEGQSPAVVVEVRSNLDPWISYIMQTEGTMKFDFSLNTTARKGLILLALGVLLALLWLPICFFFWKWVCSKRRYDCPMGTWGAVYDGTHRVTKRLGYDVAGQYVGPGRNNPLFCPATREMKEEPHNQSYGGSFLQNLSSHIKGGKVQPPQSDTAHTTDIEAGTHPTHPKHIITAASPPTHPKAQAPKDFKLPLPDVHKGGDLQVPSEDSPDAGAKQLPPDFPSNLHIQVVMDEELLTGTASDSPSSGEAPTSGGKHASPSSQPSSSPSSPSTTMMQQQLQQQQQPQPQQPQPQQPQLQPQPQPQPTDRACKKESPSENALSGVFRERERGQ